MILVGVALTGPVSPSDHLPVFLRFRFLSAVFALFPAVCVPIQLLSVLRNVVGQTTFYTTCTYMYLFVRLRFIYVCLLVSELPYGWEKVEDPHYGTYYIE